MGFAIIPIIILQFVAPLENTYPNSTWPLAVIGATIFSLNYYLDKTFANLSGAAKSSAAEYSLHIVGALFASVFAASLFLTSSRLASNSFVRLCMTSGAIVIDAFVFAEVFRWLKKTLTEKHLGSNVEGAEEN